MTLQLEPHPKTKVILISAIVIAGPVFDSRWGGVNRIIVRNVNGLCVRAVYRNHLSINYGELYVIQWIEFNGYISDVLKWAIY